MLAPIESGAGEDASPIALKQHLAAIAIVLDFVNPVLALWRLIDRASESSQLKWASPQEEAPHPPLAYAGLLGSALGEPV